MQYYLKIFIASVVGLSSATGQIWQFAEPRARKVEALRVHRVWTTFVHPLYGFQLPIPPGVRAVGHPETTAEPLFQSADQSFKMSAWGGIVRDLPPRVFAAQWNSALRKADREITYHRRGKTWFVVSGTDARGIEFYEKFTMTGQHVAFLDITFPRSLMRQYEAWVEEIEDGFRPIALQEGVQEIPEKQARNRPGAAKLRTPAELKDSLELGETAPARELESKVAEGTSKKLSADKTAAIKAKIPTADKVPRKPGFVYSPFSDDHRMVDVIDMPSGTVVRCPYTKEMFRVP